MEAGRDDDEGLLLLIEQWFRKRGVTLVNDDGLLVHQLWGHRNLLVSALRTIRDWDTLRGGRASAPSGVVLQGSTTKSERLFSRACTTVSHLMRADALAGPERSD